VRMDLRTTGMEFASEFVTKAAKLGLRMTEIPIILWPDKRGRPPHLRSFRNGWRHLRFMVLYAPNWLFLIPGTTFFLLGAALVMWLAPGPCWLGRVRFDIHTMFFGMLFALLGAQISSFGLFAKVFSYTERFDQGNVRLGRWSKRVSLETGLIAGVLLSVVGLVGDVWVFRQWATGGFGEFSQVRAIIFWSLWPFLGLEIVLSSFFLSMLGVSRGTYIGDRDFQQ